MSPVRRRRLVRTVLLALAAALVAVLAVSMLRSARGGASQPPASGPASATAPAPTGATTSATATASALVDESPEAVAPVPSASVPTSAAGTFTVVDAPAPASTATGRTVAYTLEVEDGIEVDRAQFARTVHDVLLDPRGWQAQDGVRFENVTARQVAAGTRPTIRVILATPTTVDRLCAPLRTRGVVSCHNGGKVVLNLLRWQTGVPYYGADLAGYRTYQINHEVGHSIGHGHDVCPKPGAPAPVMLQQTIGLKGCTKNPWPTLTRG